jgi:hypothetical protein
MKKKIFYLLLFCFILSIPYFLSKNEIFKPKTQIDTNKTLNIKDLNARKFIQLFIEKYDQKRGLNCVTLSGDFPKNWVKKEDVEYLISILNSNQKCCGYMNPFSSFISGDNAEVGGFAIIFLNSYITNSKIELGLNSNPKVDKKESEKIMYWYNNLKKK